MKLILMITGLLLIGSISCKKKNENIDNSCQAVTITQVGSLCSQWAIKVNNNIYPSLNIPSQFLVEGRFVCASFDLYEDMRLCACCGGTWANIKSMKYFIR